MAMALCDAGPQPEVKPAPVRRIKIKFGATVLATTTLKLQPGVDASGASVVGEGSAVPNSASCGVQASWEQHLRIANNADKVGFVPWVKILSGATSNLTGPPRDVQTE